VHKLVKRTILDSGLIILTEFRPELPSFALSFSLRSGSRAEKFKNNGIHHLIEHMIFKGSKNYDLKKIAEMSDRLGGGINAFTGKEITQFYIKAIDEKLKDSFDLLTDIVLDSIFLKDEFIKERDVVLQEIKESKDNPDMSAFELFYENLFENNSLGFPIAGREEHVSNFSRDILYDYYIDKYSPENLLLCITGNVNHSEVVEMSEKYFSKFKKHMPVDFSYLKPEFNFKTFVRKKPSLEQVYAIIGFRGIAFTSSLKYKFMLMNDILGSGMSSRLFQEIREEKGLAYTISSFCDSFLEDGVHLIYAIIEHKKIEEYLDAIRSEILILKRNGIKKEELIRAKDHIKSSFILGLESNFSKMRLNVNQELYLKREIEVSQIIDKIDKINIDEINELFLRFLNFKEVSILLYGNVKGNKFKNFKFE